jgi:hypothetical protein
MTSALVIGDAGAGRTTFVGLLYTAVVRLGTEDTDDFRFHAERESILRLEEVYGALGSGHFPEAQLSLEEQPLKFILGFRRNGLGRWSHSADDADDEFERIPLHVGGLPTEEVADLVTHSPVLDDATRHLLRSPVVIALVNAAAIPAQPGGIDGLPMARYDLDLARSLETVSKFLGVERSRKARRLYPVFVVTQFDRIPDEALRSLEAPSGEPASWTKLARTAFGTRLLETHLPETSRFLNRSRESRVVTVAPCWFFSEVATEGSGTDTRIRRRSRVPLGGWEPEYPYEEYRSLLVELGVRARWGAAAAGS